MTVKELLKFNIVVNNNYEYKIYEFSICEKVWFQIYICNNGEFSDEEGRVYSAVFCSSFRPDGHVNFKYRLDEK